jgi:hypothetical protein
MDVKLVAEAEELLRTAQRLQRAGLIVDRSVLSPAHRRAAFALECHFAFAEEEAEPQRPLIGFQYPNPR